MTGTDVDTAELEAYLSTELETDVVDADVVHDGLNLSVAVATPDADPAYVVRRPNKLRHTEAFLELEREYEVMARLRETAIPAPEPVTLCVDPSVIGDPFLVMTHLDGETVPLGSHLPERFRRPSARETLATGLVDTLADLHTVDVEPFAEACDRVPVRDQLARTVDRLDAATSVTGHDPPALRDVADWLERNAPPDSTTALVHGDYRPGNVLFAGDDQPEIAGVIDWETAFLGDPLTELGYLLLRWRDDGDPTPSLDEVVGRSSDDAVTEQLRARNERGLAPFTSEPGSPTRRDLVARYEEATGIDFEHERFYRAFAAFMLASVWADLHRHQVDAGADSDWKPHIEYMALIADSIASGEFPL